MPWSPHPQTQDTLKNMSDLDPNLCQSYILLDNKTVRVPQKFLMYLIITYLEPRIPEGLKRFTTCSSSILAFFLLLSSLCELARSTLVERQQLSTQSTNAFDTGCKKLVLRIRRREYMH